MNKRDIFYRASFSLLLLSIFSTGVLAQGRVAAYTTQTSFSGAGGWNDLSLSGNASYIGDQIFFYSNQDENGNTITANLPFDFKYDNTVESQGTTITVGPGWISFGDEPQYYTTWQDQSSDPGVMYFWGGDYNPDYGYGYVQAGSGIDQGYQYYGIYTETDGVAPNRVFTIQETDVHNGEYGTGFADNGTTYLCSMQIKLYEGSGIIQYIYQNNGQYMSGSGAIGIGLNGFTSPSFSGLSNQSGIYYTPSTDLQFTPPAPPQELSLEPDVPNYVPHVLNFGTTTPQLPITMCVTASSVGGAGSTLHITGFGLTGSNAYTIISGPPVGTAIPVGNSVNYCIQFLPLSNGNLNATFTLTTDGVDSGKQIVSLSGVGAVPLVSYSSTNMFRGVHVELTDTSGVQYLYVNSIGGGPLTVNSVSFIGIDARAYFVTHLPVGTIPGGGVDSIGVRFVPDIEGQPDAHMIINTTAANIPWDTVSMFGVGILPHLAIDSGKSWPLPTTVNFDSVKLGVDSCMTIQLSNPGSDTVAIEKNYFESSDPDFTLTPLTGRDTLIPPGGSQTIRVCFAPVQQGTRVAELRIVTNIPHTETKPYQDTSEFTVDIVGRGVPTGHLSVTGPATNGSAATGEPSCVQDTLWNTGPVDITVTSVVITGADAADFAPALPPMPFVLPANSTQLFTLCATPSDTGTQTALLTAYGTSNETADSSTLFLSVLGTLVNDFAAISQPFSVLTCMGDSDIATITVTNTGNVSTPYTASVSGTNASDFTIISPATSPTESNGGVATFQVQFVPSTNGPETANLVITGGIGHTVVLSATAGSAVIAGTGTAPVTAVDSTSAPFAVTVMNTGTCDWTTGIPTVSAPFNYASGATTIPAGQSATLMFTFSPTASGSFTSPVGFPLAVGVSLPAANVVINGATGSEDVQGLSSSNGFSLDQNYPNPFGSSSQLTITLPVGAMVNLSIIDVEGKVVQTVLNQHYDAGSFAVTLDASQLASGTYYYQMTAGGVTLTRQMVILK